MATPADPGGELSGLILSRSGLDRASHRRGDEAWLTRAWAADTTRVLVLDGAQALVTFRAAAAGTGPGADLAAADGSGGPDGSAGADGPAGAALVLVPTSQAPEGIRFLLGVDDAGVVYFAVAGAKGGLGAGPLPPPGSSPPPAGAGVRAAGLRQAAALLSDRDAGMLTQAVALANWHATHTHCPRCGAPTVPEQAGHSRRCPADKSEHFPRVDPAAIMLVTDDQDRCLLARNNQWPPHRVSILAGFVEPGESAEQTVLREVGEETGLVVDSVRYVGSQPWPMPQSLMLGFRARARGPQQIQVDEHEIAEAHWYSRDELRAAVAAREVLLPPPVSIAHRIIESWFGEPLPGSW
ncbi:MAG TPA: NAD(+) diphosphatase [Streptosporangiaceae bacterium]